MKTCMVLLLTAALAFPASPIAHAQPIHKTAHTKNAAITMYTCPICHHEVNAAKAKSLHYTCPVDGGKLVPAKTVSLHKAH